MKSTAIWLLACCLMAGFGRASAGEHACCAHSGCQAACEKVCRLVCETKKVTKIEYSCQCEDFCVPGPSERCVTVDCCGDKQVHYTPTCATVRTRAKLVKHERVEEKPSFK